MVRMCLIVFGLRYVYSLIVRVLYRMSFFNDYIWLEHPLYLVIFEVVLYLVKIY
jgi:hypothetical protein